MQIIVYNIKMDKKSFIAKLSDKKLEKAVKITGKILGKQSVIFFDI